MNILLLEDVHASADGVLHGIPRAEIVRLRHAPQPSELRSLLADAQELARRAGYE